MDNGKLVGFLTRKDVIISIHRFGMNKTIKDIMRKEFPLAKITDSLVKVQMVMQENSVRAVPVIENGVVRGIISLEDISKVYAMLSSKK